MNSNRRSFLKLSGLVLAGVGVARTGAFALKPDDPKPNIVLCMADDMGWGDVGFNGHKRIKTPTLDAMAASGVRFDRFYAGAPVCSPTRGSVMTGRHPYRYGIFFANVGHMRKEEVTLAEALKTQGYATGHFGKWHQGTLTTKVKDANRGKPGDSTHYSPPWENGFDECFSTESKVPTYDPMVQPDRAGGKSFWNPIKPGEKESDYGTHYWTGPEQMAKGNLKGDDSSLIMDRAIPFIRKAVEQQQPFFAVVWFHAPHWPVVAGDKHRALYKDLDDFKQNHYGCITALDEQMGRLRGELRTLGVAENTLLTFCSDNGPEGTEKSGMGSAGPYRGRKRSLYEGGIRVPGLLEWPARVRKPCVVTMPCVTSDYFPTVLDSVGFQIQGRPEPVDGISLLPAIEGKMTKRPAPIGFQSSNQVALSDNQYKIYSKNGDKKFELYDLLADPYETKDLAEEKPEVVEKMRVTLETWQASCKASLDGKDYK